MSDVGPEYTGEMTDGESAYAKWRWKTDGVERWSVNSITGEPIARTDDFRVTFGNVEAFQWRPGDDTSVHMPLEIAREFARRFLL